MKSQYSIISAQTNPEIGEKIIVGILMVSDNYVNFSASKNKLSIAKALLNKELYQFLIDTITQLEKSTTLEINTRNGIYGNKLSDLKIGATYIEYLSRYSNGLINFSSPSVIDLEANDEVFTFLYKKYVDNKDVIAHEKISKSIDVVKHTFLPEVKPYYNVEKKITTSELANLTMTVKVDVIGKNEIPVFAQFVDFQRKLHFIREDVAVIKFLKDAYQNNHSQGFLIGSEPPKNYHDGYEAYTDLKNWNAITFLDISEVEKIKEYATTHGVEPLFAE